MSTKDASQRRPALIVRKEENNKNNKRRDVPLFLGKKLPAEFLFDKRWVLAEIWLINRNAALAISADIYCAHAAAVGRWTGEGTARVPRARRASVNDVIIRVTLPSAAAARQSKALKCQRKIDVAYCRAFLDGLAAPLRRPPCFCGHHLANAVFIFHNHVCCMYGCRL